MVSPLSLHVSRKRAVVKLCTNERSAKAHTWVTMVRICRCLLQMAQISKAHRLSTARKPRRWWSALPRTVIAPDKHKLANSNILHARTGFVASKQKEQAMRTTCCMMLWSKCRTLMRKPWSPDPGQCKNCLRVSTVSTGKAAVQKWNHVKPRGQRQCLQALVAVANSPASPSEPPEQGASLSGSEPIS